MKYFFKNCNILYSKILNINPFYLSLFFLAIYNVPYLILGEKSFIPIIDNLDSGISGAIIVGKNCVPFSNTIINQIMNGIPSFCFQSSLNITILLFKIFQPFTAYILNDFIVRGIAFIGMYLLLKNHFLSANNKVIIIGVSLCFMVIPFFTMYGLSVAGQPLLLFAFLNLLKGQIKWYSYVIIIFFPLYSSFVLSGIFICLLLATMLIYDTVEKRRINYSFLVGLVIFSLLFLIVDYNLFISFFNNSSFISHRSEWQFESISFLSKVKSTIFLIVKTQIHTGAFYTILVILLVGYEILVSKKYLEKTKFFLLSLIWIFGFYFLNFYLIEWFGSRVPLLISFQWNRFYFLLPCVWLILFSISLNNLNFRKNSRTIVYTLIVIQFFTMLISDTPYLKNWLMVTFVNKEWNSPSYKQFFAQKLFHDINSFINRDQKDYRVVSLGIHPSVSQYNGYFTIDGYISSYPLEYKRNFRKIISKELVKNTTIKEYFDLWGSRCYLFSSELGKTMFNNDLSQFNYKRDPVILKNLELNTYALSEMNCDYIISAVKIENYSQNNLEFLKEFSDKDAWWRIFLYKVIVAHEINH